MACLSPVRILKPLAEEEKGENARLSNFVGAIAVGDLMMSTLGPKGMDKMLVKVESATRSTVSVTNDGATLLRSLGLDNPGAQILVNMAKGQAELVGDGTTSVVIFASQLLKEAEIMISKKIHPQTIITGYRHGCKVALETLESLACDIDGTDELLRKNLMNIARTSLSSKILNMHKEKFSEIAVDAILLHKVSKDLKSMSIIKIPGGTLEDSFLDNGFILAKKTGIFQQKRIENAKILIANASLDMDKPKCFGSRVRVDSISKLAELESAEKANMKEKIECIKKTGCNVLVNRQQIYDYPEQLLADTGIMTVELADFEGVERLALATGGEVVSTFEEVAALGRSEVVEELAIGERTVLRFGGVARREACSVVLRGASAQLLDEAERALRGAVCALAAGLRAVCGGGAAELEVAGALDRAAEVGFSVQGGEPCTVDTAPETASAVDHTAGVALAAYARAVLSLPRALADNAGLDADEALTELRADHSKGYTTHGLDLGTGRPVCMRAAGVMEPLAVKRQLFMSALEATELILRVDHILKKEPRRQPARRF